MDLSYVIFTDLLKSFIAYYIGFVAHELGHLTTIKLKRYKVTGAIIYLFTRRRKLHYGLRLGIFFFPPPTKRDAIIIAYSGTIAEITVYLILIFLKFVITIIPLVILMLLSIIYLVRFEIPRTLRSWMLTPGELYFFFKYVDSKCSSK